MIFCPECSWFLSCTVLPLRFSLLLACAQVPLPKEVSDSPKPNSDSEDESSYTGMATALANAIRERRQHISDKRKEEGKKGEGNFAQLLRLQVVTEEQI